MKKAFRLIAILLPVVLTATGCDFFRKLAGRPVSADIAVMAENIRLEEETAVKAREDSIAAVRQHEADSVAAVEFLKGEKVLGSSKVGGIKVAEQLPRYSIILGAFSNISNAEKYASQLEDRGYPSRIIPFGNTFTGVGICSTDDVVSISNAIREVKAKDFCPDGVWILENRLQ